MANLEQKIVQLIRSGGGVMNLSDLSSGYKKAFNEPMPPREGKVSKWLQQFNSIILIKVAERNITYLYLNEYFKNIKSILSRGALDIKSLSEKYKTAFGEAIPSPKGVEVGKWLKQFEEITTSNGPSSERLYSIKANSCFKIFVTSMKQLEDLLMLNHNTDSRLSIYCELLGDKTIVLFLYCQKFCAIIDCEMFEEDSLRSTFNHYFQEVNNSVVVYDFNELSERLDNAGLTIYSEISLYDTQLAIELITGKTSISLYEMANRLNTPTLLNAWKKAKSEEVKRPLQLKEPIIAYTIDKVKIVFEAQFILNEMLSTKETNIILAASKMRFGMDGRDTRFIVTEDYKMCSFELATLLHDNESISVCNKITVHHEPDVILSVLPPVMRDELIRIGTNYISDLSLDISRKPLCWWKGERKWLPIGGGSGIFQNFSSNKDDRVVNEGHIKDILEKIGYIGSDNRAGFDGALHRVSCVKNRRDDIIGFTIRFGRHVSGNVDMIRDILCGSHRSSVLFLGEPGSGKTTIVREATKILAENENVFIVDTSNEIAGDGNLPHECVGNARRLMVKNLKDQADVMVECVQNHTPSTMVIDEIGRPAEVLAAKTSKHRGVRMIASAHGDFRSLVKNKDLNGLIGGLSSVTLGDKEAREEADRKGHREPNKQKTQRSGSPIFEIVIELRRGIHNEWVIIMDAAAAVDKILDGKQYNVQRRIRDADTGTFYMKKDLL